MHQLRHRQLVFDSCRELCVNKCWFVHFLVQKLGLSCVKLCAIFGVIEVVFLHKITTSSNFNKL